MINTHIKAQQQIPLNNITNNIGEPASWNDLAWVINKPNGTRLNLYFLDPNIVKKPHFALKSCSRKEMLPELLRHIVMCYALDLLASNEMSKSQLRNLLRSARYILCYIGERISEITQRDINEMFEANTGMTWLVRSKPFIMWCQNNKLIRPSIRTPKMGRDERGDSYSLESVLERKAKKMPDERALRVLAAISNDILPECSKSANINTNDMQRASFVACMTTLAMASPNRIGAEQVILAKQSLKSRKATRIEDGKTVTKVVHWLDWNGSKGYKDNNNHILASMAVPVSRAVDYLNIVCEPTRVLCRFYENPTQSLEQLLGSFTSTKLQAFDKDDRVNLFQLGYILGFYDNHECNICLWNPDSSSQAHLKQYKHISQLCDNDILIFNSKSLSALLGIRAKNITKIKAALGQRPTIAEFQENWINHIKKATPSFPYRINASNKVRLSNALFCFSGAQLLLRSQKKENLFSGSFYSIESIDLYALFSGKLNGKCHKSIFEDFGFSSDIRISPHQFRHWLNTKGQESGLSDEVIALWSGRTSIEQNLVYDHVSDSSKIAQIADVLATPEKITKEIRVITQEEYQQATGKIASVTATGFCTQQLAVNPCVYLNDFVAQCTLCSSSCYVNRDQKAIDILEKDLLVQQIRLDQIKNNRHINTSVRLQNWFITHHRNTSILEQLITLMKREDIKKGSPIRYIGDMGIYRVIDTAKRSIEEIKAALPDSRCELEKLTTNNKNLIKQNENKLLEDLMSKFGIAPE